MFDKIAGEIKTFGWEIEARRAVVESQLKDKTAITPNGQHRFVISAVEAYLTTTNHGGARMIVRGRRLKVDGTKMTKRYIEDRVSLENLKLDEGVPL